MRSPRYTILIANRNTGAVRRLAVRRRPLFLSAMAVLAVPVVLALAGIGIGQASQAEYDALKLANENLRIENDSYREATGELAEQVATLQTALAQLGDSSIDPATLAAIEKLPAVVRSRAMGGSTLQGAMAKQIASTSTPATTFGVLRDLLGSLEDRIDTVRSRVEKQQALARATPSLFPVAGFVSSLYGPRKDPFTGGPDFHAGVDFSAPHGTPVKATADGTVEAIGYMGNYGNAIVLTHGYGIGTRYGHLSRFAVQIGQTVKRNQIIGFVGSTGRATSSHLHFEILLNKQPINPLRILAAPRSR
jgi:murein DD-endopeptidase MepM/ murein hydrolase activator NlpD